MSTMLKQIMGLTAVFSALSCGLADAQRPYNYHPRPHHYYYNGRAPHFSTVVVRPAATVHISNRLDRKDRLRMAVAYLDKNEYLSVKKYAGMTGLTKGMAEAELDAFAHDKRTPVVLVVSGKKKLYTRR